MVATDAASRVFMPSMVTELPADWTVTERSTVTSPSGVAINLRVDRVPDGSDATDFIERLEAAAVVEAKGVETMAASTVRLFGGRIGQDRLFTCARDGAVWNGRIVCMVDDGLALSASAWWDSAIDAAAAEVDVVVSGMRLRHRSLFAPIDGLPAADGSGARRTEVSPAAWSPLRSVWSHATPEAAAQRDLTRWSPDELAVCASIKGAPSFPTIDPGLLMAMPSPMLAGTVDAVTRSLLARGILCHAGHGTGPVAEEFDGLLDAAVFPDLTIQVERLGDPGNARWWFGLQLDRATQVTVLPSGARECNSILPSEVVGHVLALAGFADTATGIPQDGAAISRVTVHEVGGGSSTVAALIRFSTSWRDGDRVLHGSFTCGIGPTGPLWIAETEPVVPEAPPSWKLRSTDLIGVRDELLAHLPGA